MVEVGRSVEVELVTLGGVPEDKALGVHEVEVGDGEAVIAVEPDGQEGLGGGAFGAERGCRELNLFVGHALDGDLSGGAAADGGDDDEPVRADRDGAVAGGFGAGRLGLALKRLECFLPEVMELTLKESNRVGVGQLQQVLVFSDSAGSAARSTRLTRLVLSEAVKRSASSEARGKWVGFVVFEPGLSAWKLHRFVELGDQRGWDDPVDVPGRATTPASGTWRILPQM